MHEMPQPYRLQQMQIMGGGRGGSGQQGSATSMRRRHVILMLTSAAVAAMVSVLVIVSAAYAYNGSFCYGKHLAVYASCTSVSRTHIRRAIAHGRDYTFVEIEGGTRRNTSSCYTDGCTADTGYLPSDVNGNAGVTNAGDPCDCGGGTYYGWLYP